MRMVPVHPGRLLKREMAARELSANALARALRAPPGRIIEIVNGKRAISPETALRLRRNFGKWGPILGRVAGYGRPRAPGERGVPPRGARVRCKTNLAMVQPAIAGWSCEFIRDDIACGLAREGE